MALSIELVRNTTAELRSSGFVRAVKSDRVISFRSSTPDLDRHGTRILPEGIRTDNYDKNPVFLWGHDAYGGLSGASPMDAIIGRTLSHSKSAHGFDHEVEFATADLNPEAEKALRYVRAGFLNATSIGFSPIRWHEEKPLSEARNAPPVIVFDEVELLEVSLVAIPSNPNAQALARAIAGGEDVEKWVRSAIERHAERALEAPERLTTQSESDETEATQSEPLVDLIRNVTVEPYRPRSGVLRAVSQIRSRPSWR